MTRARREESGRRARSRDPRIDERQAEGDGGLPGNVVFWLAFAPSDYGFSLRVDQTATSPW